MRAAIALLLISTTNAPANVLELGDEGHPTKSPGFVNIVRYDGNSRGGIDVMDLVLAGDVDGAILRFDAHGHYVHADSGLGGYAQIPFSVVSIDGSRSTVVGGLAVGGIWIPHLGSRRSALVLHAGATLPTASDDSLAGAFTRSRRPTDIYQELPRSSTVRLGVSPMLRSVPRKIKIELFARMDIGLDVNLYRASDETIGPGAYVNLGAGFVFSHTAVMAESSLQHIFGDGTNAGLALSMRARAHSSIQPYVAVIDGDPSFDFALVCGVEARP